MTFGKWPEHLHNEEAQKKRMVSAASAALTPIDIDHKAETAMFSGRHGVYQTNLDLCPCGDFRARHLPCKHIYRLAYELHHIDLGCTVMYNADAVVNPDETDRADNALRIEAIIDSQPSDSYISVLAVLQIIRSLGRPISSIDAAIRYLESKIEAEHTIAGCPQFAGMTYVLTGNFSEFTRGEAASWLETKGARVSGSISKKTNYLVAGKVETESAESKLQRARELGVSILTEHEFLQAIQG